MRDSAHTRGPWRPAGRNGGWDGVDAEDGTMICHLEYNNPANGRLIAAAPELLDALSFLVWRSIDKDNMEFRATISCYQMDTILAALAKAGA